MELAACVALLGSSFTWAFGSVLSRRWKVAVDPLVASGWQMVAAGAIDGLVGLARGDHHRATWNVTSWAAIFYLVVFGSWIGTPAVHLAAATRPDVEGRDLRLREPGRRGIPRLGVPR